MRAYSLAILLAGTLGAACPVKHQHHPSPALPPASPGNTSQPVLPPASPGNTSQPVLPHHDSPRDRSVSLPGLPSDCLTSHSGISWGWLPDDATKGHVSMKSLQAINKGRRGCFFGAYSKITSAADYDGHDLTTYRADEANGAIMVPSIMPVGVTWDQIDSELAAKIANVARQLTSKGLTVYLRFAHEMNCYAKPGCASPPYPGLRDLAGYKRAWARVAGACKGVAGCYMMWSPNMQDLSSLDEWWPGAEHVDVIGVSHYARSDADVAKGFSGNFGVFYDKFVKTYGKPFVITETGYAGSAEGKAAWVEKLTVGDELAKFPLYKGVMWFEYDKHEEGEQRNFYAVVNQSKSVVAHFNAKFQ